MPDPAFSPALLRGALDALQARGVRRWLVALSGGGDSSCLLAALAELRGAGDLPGDLQALHVHHGGRGEVAATAQGFVRACEAICGRLDVPLQVHRHDGLRPADEAGLRELRYAALRRRLGAGEAALTAHHRRDQAETLLLRLLRGAGPRGLSGMQARRDLGPGLLLRPLLDVDPQALHDWAPPWLRAAWVQDPANASPDPDRNFLRGQVLPLLRRRWPAADDSLALVSALQAETAGVLEGLAAEDLRRCGAAEGQGCRWVPLLPWRDLPAPRRHNAVRALCRAQGWAPPPLRCLAQDACLQSPAGELRWRDWSGGQVLLQRRDWNGRAWLCLRLRPEAPPGPQLPLRWDPRAQPELRLAEGVLQAVPAPPDQAKGAAPPIGGSIANPATNGSPAGRACAAVPLCPRGAWEVAAVGPRPRQHLGTAADGTPAGPRLKQLFARHRLASWAQRDWPLVRDPANGRVLAVPGLWSAPPAAASANTSAAGPAAPRYLLRWRFHQSPPA